MLILLNKKILQYYKVDLESLPPNIFTVEAIRAGICKNIFMYEADYINNLNTQPELVNVKHVKRFSIFNYKREFGNVIGKEYLKGSKTQVIFNDNSSIFVTEELNEIMRKTGAA